MKRFEITGNDDFLQLSLHPGARKAILAILLAVYSFLCISILGVLAVVKGDVIRKTQVESDFFNPQGNHFGFLWLVSTLLAGILIPLYAAFVLRNRIVFTFDKRTNIFTKNRETVCSLGKIEYVRLDHADDPDHRMLHKVVVSHTDGFELTLDDWYDEPEMTFISLEIATFVGVRLVGERVDNYDDGGLIPRDTWKPF